MPLFIQLREMVRIIIIVCRTNLSKTIPRWAYLSCPRPLFFRYLISPYSFSLSLSLSVFNSLSVSLILSLLVFLSPYIHIAHTLSLSHSLYLTFTLSFSLSLTPTLSVFVSLSLSFSLSLRLCLRLCHRYIRHPNPILCCWHSPRPGVHASERNRLQRPETRELPH